MATWLKTVLQQRHLQNHELFLAEYEKAATELGQVEPGPSRTQFHRWLSGELTRLPQPRHCRVLETMLPQWSAADLFAETTDDRASFKPAASTVAPTEIDTAAMRSRPGLDGTIVDLATRIEIEINEDGHALVRYSYKILNLTDVPITRIPRAIWFKHVHDQLTIEPTQYEPYQTFIQRQIEAGPNHAMFAYNFSPAIPPGGTAQYGCECTGGQFVDEPYWRHSVQKGTDALSISVLHRSKKLKRCIATEEMVDGSEELITDDVQWRQTDEGISLQLERGSLLPTQAVMVTWEVDDA